MSHTGFSLLSLNEYNIKDNEDDDDDEYDYPKLEIDESRDAETDLTNLNPCLNIFETWATYPYQCVRCKNICSNLLELREHSLAIHGVSNGFQCADCTVVVPSLFALVEHVRQHRPALILYCPICNKKLKDCGHTSEDLPLASWKEYPWACQFCTAQFQNLAILKNHLKEVHSKCFGFKCADCSTKFKNFEKFREHVKKHRPVLGEHCEICDTKINSQCQYIIHIQEHTLEFKCGDCGESFRERTELETHFSLYNTSRQKKPETKPFTCDFCGKEFANAIQCENHRAIHTDRKRDQLCDRCGKFYLSRTALYYHILTHKTKDHICEICNEGFYTPRRLKQHLLKHLKHESSSTHFECAECSRRFRLKKYLVKHMLCHSDKTPYKCHYCDKSFKCPSVLKTHENRHIGAKPYACPYCDMNFLYRRRYNRHVQHYHGDTTTQGNVRVSPKEGKPKKK